MPDKNIGRFLTIAFLSGILKSKREDILPPPPPFPKFELEDFEKQPIEEKPQELGKKQIEAKKQEEFERKKALEAARKAREDEKRQKKLERKKAFEEGKKAKEEEIIRKREQRELERKAQEKRLKIIEKKPAKPPKKFIQEEDMELDEELEELKEEIAIPKTKKEIKLLSKAEEEIEKPEEIKKAEEEIQRAIEGIKIHAKKGFIFKRLFRPKEKKQEAEELPLEFMPRTHEKRNAVEDILDMVHKARSALMEFDLGRAKSIYIGIMGVYSSLSDDNKRKVYHEVKDLYDERKNAESLNIR